MSAIHIEFAIHSIPLYLGERNLMDHFVERHAIVQKNYVDRYSYPILPVTD